jgi:hypothetical protein
VTALDTGAVVPKAQVSVQDCDGKEHWNGVTDARGVVRISKALPARDQLPAASVHTTASTWFSRAWART